MNIDKMANNMQQYKFSYTEYFSLNFSNRKENFLDRYFSEPDIYQNFKISSTTARQKTKLLDGKERSHAAYYQILLTAGMKKERVMLEDFLDPRILRV